MNGIHLMAVGWEEIIPTEAGLLPADFCEHQPLHVSAWMRAHAMSIVGRQYEA